MLTAFQVIMLVTLVISGGGGISDSKPGRYMALFAMSGILFLASAVIKSFGI